MKKINKSDWQKPFVDVFKKYKVFESSRSAKKGAVSALQDNNIGRKIFKVSGAVSASNYVVIPDPDSGIKNLSLHGNFVYLEFFQQKGKFFNIHLDFQIQGYDPTIRFTISNMFEAYNRTSGNVLQIPFPRNAPEKWTVMVLDIPFHLENFGLFETCGFTNFEGIHLLKGIQICSQVLVRGIYTSDNVYKISTLPKDMNFKLPAKGESWSSVYQLVYYPEEADPDFMNDMQQQGPASVDIIQQEIKESADPIKMSSINEMKKQVSKPIDQNIQQQQLLQEEEEINESRIPQATQQTDDFIKKSFYQSQQKAKASTQIEGLQPYPIAQLNHTIGFSGRYCPDIKWSRTQDSPNELIYAAGSVLVSAEVGSNNQRFFVGHSAPISCMDLSKDGKYIATAQEGKKSLVKIWDYCENQNICTFQSPYEDIKCISFSYNNKLLATVGRDNHNREIVMIWNIDDIENKKKPELLAKQVSDFNIISLKFSPIELDKLVSCGKENIRFWRIKNGHLPAQTVVLNHHARNTVFTVLDYEFSYLEPSAARQSQEVKRVFVGSKNGMLYQVDYHTKLLEGVYKCHEGAITSLALSAGFCVTGSEDQFLRVWPLDFSEYLIVAKHEGVIHSLDVSQDALMVACGTSTGGLGVLDLSNQNYKTFLRSHTDEIIQMVYHDYSKLLITLSSDLSIRLWDLEKYEQVYEFSYPPEDYCTGIAAHNNSMTFVAGFASGTFRVFDIEKTCIIEECRYHNTDITDLKYNESGQHLIVADSSSYYSIYDVERNYQPIKSFECEMPSEYQSIAISKDNNIIATIGDSGTHINIFDAQTLTPALKMFCPNTTIQKLVFAANNVELFVITADSKIKVFGIQMNQEGAEAYFLREMACTHRNQCTDIAFSDNFKYLASVGGDSLLKIWDYDFSLKGPGSNQIFMAHLGRINNCIFLPGSNKILTTGGFEGIYEWEFLGDLTPQERDINFDGLTPQASKPVQKRRQQASLTHSRVSQELKMDFSEEEEDENNLQQNIQQQQYQLSQDQQQQIINQQNYQQTGHQKLQSNLPPQQQEEFQVTESDLDERLDQYDAEQLDKQQTAKAQDILSNMSMQFSKTQGQVKTKFQPIKVEQKFETKVVDYKKQSKQRNRHRRKQGYELSALRKQHKLPFKQYYQEKISDNLNEKINRIRDNPEDYNLDYIIGFNNDSHDNIVWNYMKGWFAYAVENVIIIEQLDKERSQKVVQCPDYITCLIMSKDFKYILAGSASKNDKDIACIHVIESTKLTFTNKLNYHTRGVQSMQFNENGKYLVSVGNFKECTVCVWEWPTGKLISSSYTMDKINDVKVSNKCFSYDRQIEFVTVGRDQVQFWALNKENKLEYFDVFIDKNGEENYPEATAVDYIQHGESYYAMVGLTTGEFLLYEYGTFREIYRKKVAQGEIVNIQGNSLLNRVVMTALDGNLYYWDTDKFGEFIPSFVKLSFPSSPVTISLEPTYNEGIAGCINGGIFYFNLANQYQSMLTSTIDINNTYTTQSLDGDLIQTSHSDGKLRIWNVKTGEEIIGYNFKSPVSASFYNQSSQKLTCLFQNNNEVKILDLSKFSSSETFVENSYLDSDKKSQIYPIKAFEGILGGKQNKFIMYNNGTLCTLENLIVQKKQIYRQNKILELEGVQDLQFYNEKSIIIVSDKRGRINTYLVDYNSDREIPYGFTSIDDFDIYDNPHGPNIDSNQGEQAVTALIYKESEAQTKITVSKLNPGCYYATNTTLQYLFIRNYQKRQVIDRFVLYDFPLYPSIYENKSSLLVQIALQNGSVEQVDINNKEDRKIMQGMLDGPIVDIIAKRSKNQIILATQNGLCFYKVQPE